MKFIRLETTANAEKRNEIKSLSDTVLSLIPPFPKTLLLYM